MRENKNYYANENNKYNRGEKNIRNQEKFSDKMETSKFWPRAKAIRENEKLDDFITAMYNDANKRNKLIEGVQRRINKY